MYVIFLIYLKFLHPVITVNDQALFVSYMLDKQSVFCYSHLQIDQLRRMYADCMRSIIGFEVWLS